MEDNSEIVKSELVTIESQGQFLPKHSTFFLGREMFPKI